MPWSNEIPNPLVVGGGGTSGEIIILDASGFQIGSLNDQGLIFVLPAWIGDASYAVRVSPGGLLLTPGEPQFYPNPVTWWAGRVEVSLTAPTDQPNIFIGSPAYGTDYSGIRMWGVGPYGGVRRIETSADETQIFGSIVLSGSTSATLGFFGDTGVAQQTVTGDIEGNAALESLLSVLSSHGLIVDSTTSTDNVFSARQTVAQSISTGTYTAITFTTEDIDIGAIHSTSSNTSRVTPNIAGWYECHGQVGFTSGSSTYRRGALFMKNGSIVQGTFVPISAGDDTGELGAHTCAFIQCNGSTDYIELGGWQDSGGSINTATGDASSRIIVTLRSRT